MLAVRFARYGPPADVLEVVDLPDPPRPGDGEVLVDFEAAPVNPSDIHTIAGDYGIRPELPATPGYEGVGRVSAVGDGVTHLKAGDRVLLTAWRGGTWRERGLARASRLFALPD